ncbi:MAG: TatD family hydrolase [Candidatus Saccharimonadales bacterium]|jgi:TatD DNase family protein
MNLQFVDSHCHIHFLNYDLSPEIVINDAKQAGVSRLICVGCSLEDSRLAITMAQAHANIYATVGLHPHEAVTAINDQKLLEEFNKLLPNNKIVAIGECGLDYYRHKPSPEQLKLLEFQLGLAQTHNLPLVFHIREAFADFWPVFDNFKGLKGVVHSFNATTKELDQVLSRGLYIGLNGIITFSHDEAQLLAAKAVPLDHLLLETDAPYLTPKPYRGKVNESKYIRVIAEFLSELRSESLKTVALATTRNAKFLFNIK